VCEPELVISEAFDAYADPYKRVVSKVFKSFFLRVSEVLKKLYFSGAVLQVSCGFLSLSLSRNLVALFSPACACKRSNLENLAEL
jgi:hypothetical protein